MRHNQTFNAMATKRADKGLKEQVLNSLPMKKELTTTTWKVVSGIVDRLAQLSRLDLSDVPALSILALEYDKVLRASEQLKEEELITPDGRKNQLLTIVNSSEQIVLALIKEFGLSARGRKTLDTRDTKARPLTALEAFENEELDDIED